MLKQLLFVIAMFLTVSVPVFAASGFDDQGNPNDPTVNDRANACYEGGTLYGHCETELIWEAGWYLIRFEFGLISREDFPSGFAWVLPVVPVLESSAVDVSSGPAKPPAPSTCAFAWNPDYYVDFSGGNFVGSGNYWSDTDCTVPNGVLARKWVFSPSGLANATTICIANLGVGFVAIPSHGPLVFECI